MSNQALAVTHAGERLGSPQDFSPALRSSLRRMAEKTDRSSPTAFVGREDEIALLNAAVRGSRLGEAGHTVVVQGLPGVGKTAILHEYASRVWSTDFNGERVVPVPLPPGELDVSPMGLVRLIDLSIPDEDMRAKIAAKMGANMLAAWVTKKTFADFKPSSDAPDSFLVALKEYAAFQFEKKPTTFLLLVDDAQDIPVTSRTRSLLSAAHLGLGSGNVNVALACFGLSNTTEHLAEDLGLSRLASDYVRTLGVLSDDEAKRTVRKTLELGLKHFTFDEEERNQWITAATSAILEDSANFPHHLANGCRALGRILLNEGISREPLVDRLREKCGEYRREYYDARLKRWQDHTTALAYGFGTGDGSGASVANVRKALMVADEIGNPVERDKANDVVIGLRDAGLIEIKGGMCRLLVPSMATHFREIRSDDDMPVAKTIQDALSSSEQERGGV